MMGGYGYATENDMERHARRSIVATIYGGPSGIERERYAHSDGGSPSSNPGSGTAEPQASTGVFAFRGSRATVVRPGGVG
jgi:Acyl-CoA dehydrogenase, C-terminal domain